MRRVWSLLLLGGLIVAAHAQTPPPTSSTPDPAASPSSPSPRSPRSLPAPPRSDASEGESSSNRTKVDLSPPPGEAGLDLRPGASDVQEFKPWDPHKADKCVEIGDFYYKRKNYSAAISRYREALYWKSDHALAFFRLGQALEQTGQYDEARKSYEQYLKILPKGTYATQSQKALEKLGEKTATSTGPATKPNTPKTTDR